MPRDCLRIIESKSKVRNSRNKPVVAKVSASTSTPGISSEVAELKDMVKALLLDKKNQSPAPTPIKAVEQSCVTYGGAHSYQTCPATTGNVYRYNIQEYVSQAAATNFNQGNTGYRALISNQIRPPGCSTSGLSTSSLSTSSPQIQGVSKEDFQAYVKANDVVMRNMQTQGSGTLPSNIVTNPKDDLKGITTRSGVAYKGPTIPTTSSPKVVKREVVEHETEVTKDTMPPINNGSTEDVQPPVVPVNHHESISESIIAPVSAPMPNQKALIPFPSRRNDERPEDFLCNKAMGKSNFQRDFRGRRIFEPDTPPGTLDSREEILKDDPCIDRYEYSQEVLGFSNVISSGNPTPYYDPIVSTLSQTLTLFGDSDFLLFEEADSFLGYKYDPIFNQEVESNVL
ncbi:hypothetical protein Tco_0834852 [Tanacetum coccineum]